VAADPASVYDLVSDVTRVSEWSPETVAARWLDGATGPAVGVRFQGDNRIGRVAWSTKPTITVAERGVRFAFQVPGASGGSWSFDLEAVPGGTRLTESVTQAKPSPPIIRFLQRRAGVTDRQAHLHAGIESSLVNIASILTSAVVV
jgi:hypothetical protein